MHVKIENIEYFLPNNLEDNKLLSSENPDWKMDKIYSKTGIDKRYIAKEINQTTTYMAVEAAKKIKDFNNLKVKIDAVICITQTPEHHLPTSACIIQNKLGLKKECMAFDINLGCSGFVYGLSIAASLIESNMINNCLLICSEKYSTYIKNDDRTTRTLFSDGAAATFIKKSKNKNFNDFIFGTDGSGFDKLIVPKKNTKLKNDIIFKDNLFMSGADIFTFTISTVPKLVKEILQRNQLNVNDIDVYIFHQASKLVLDSLTKSLKIPNEKIFNNYDKIGNTVSASIPIAMKDALDSKYIKKGHKIMLIGFGVGLSWGACVIDW